MNDISRCNLSEAYHVEENKVRDEDEKQPTEYNSPLERPSGVVIGLLHIRKRVTLLKLLLPLSRHCVSKTYQHKKRTAEEHRIDTHPEILNNVVEKRRIIWFFL